MAVFSINNVSLKAVSSIVPPAIENNWDLSGYSEQEKKTLISTTGIEKRRRAGNEITAADLCIQAAEKVLNECAVDKTEIDIVVFVTQTPDHTIPGSSMFIQNKLGLSNRCIAFDINQGCAGYVYGLSVISSMMANGHLRKGLLLVGDTITRTISSADRSLVPIFSDAGSCSLLEYSEYSSPMYFNLQTNGAGFEKIIVKGGGARVTRDADNGFLYMNGQDIFNFGLQEVAANVDELLRTYDIPRDKVDYFVMHQANMLLNESIRKKSGIAAANTLYSLKDFGNTSCATIPVTLSANASKLKKNPSLLLTGFGVGLSWGSVFLQTNELKCFPIDEFIR